MQHRITKPSNLLDKQGELIQKGYATSPLLRYQRKDAAWKLRLKEWDYYLIYNNNYAIALTVAQSTSIVLISASFINFNDKTERTKTFVRVVPHMSMPQSSKTGDIQYQDSEVNVSIRHVNHQREINLWIKDFNQQENTIIDTLVQSIQKPIDEQKDNDRQLELCITLSPEPKDSMTIATPFKESKKQFYYNQKIIGMIASGSVKTGDKTYFFAPYESFGLLDWGRGIWPYKTTWYWGASQGFVDGNLFGFNLGYGFGDTSAATENMLFFNGHGNKLDDVTFHIPKNTRDEYEYMKPWIITSSDRRLNLKFTPILDRNANLSIIILSTNQHQVFGKYSGTAVLDDSTIIYLNDFLGFAERVENRW